MCLYWFCRVCKNEEKLTEAPAKNVKMKKLSLSVYKMILLRFGVWGTKSGGQLQKLCNFEKESWSLCTTWYGVPAFLAALLTTRCIDF